MMKCPRKFGKLPFEGGEECADDCALAVRLNDGSIACAQAVVAAAVASDERWIRVNTLKAEETS